MAIVLDDAARVLLMRRAERVGDRWSSQVSLPGGMENPSDAGLRATAERETLEEMGVDLRRAACLGGLDELRAVANGGLRPMSVAPFVYRLREPVTPALSGEVARVFWLPLDRAARGELDGTLRWPILGQHVRFACFRHDGEEVWGLTLGILRRLLALARP